MNEVLLSTFGDYSVAIDASQVGSIADVDAETVADDETFYDLSDLVGVPPPEGARRMLEISDDESFLLLLTSSSVRLQKIDEIQPVQPPAFLQHLWQDLYVQSLLPTDPPAMLLDIPALLQATRSSNDN